LYTAVTRAKKLVVLVGSRRAIGQAVRTVSAGRAAVAGAGGGAALGAPVRASAVRAAGARVGAAGGR
ncbi:hypothetical protein, partial [Streptomyces sp. NPDC003374]